MKLNQFVRIKTDYQDSTNYPWRSKLGRVTGVQWNSFSNKLDYLITFPGGKTEPFFENELNPCEYLNLWIKL